MGIAKELMSELEIQEEVDSLTEEETQLYGEAVSDVVVSAIEESKSEEGVIDLEALHNSIVEGVLSIGEEEVSEGTDDDSEETGETGDTGETGETGE